MPFLRQPWGRGKVFFQNDETTPCSGQPWKSCGRMGITPGLPPASLPAAHPRAQRRRRRDPRAVARFSTRAARAPGGVRGGHGGDGPPTAGRSAPPPHSPPPAAPRRSPGEELKKGQALRRVAAPSSPGKEFPPPRAHAAPRPRPILLRKEADFAGE